MFLWKKHCSFLGIKIAVEDKLVREAGQQGSAEPKLCGDPHRRVLGLCLETSVSLPGGDMPMTRAGSSCGWTVRLRPFWECYP